MLSRRGGCWGGEGGSSFGSSPSSFDSYLVLASLISQETDLITVCTICFLSLTEGAWGNRAQAGNLAWGNHRAQPGVRDQNQFQATTVVAPLLLDQNFPKALDFQVLRRAPDTQNWNCNFFVLPWNVLGPNFLDPKLTRLTHLVSFASILLLLGPRQQQHHGDVHRLDWGALQEEALWAQQRHEGGERGGDGNHPGAWAGTSTASEGQAPASPSR